MKKFKLVFLGAALLLLCMILGIWVYEKIPPPLDWILPEFKLTYNSVEWKSFRNVPLSVLQSNTKIIWQAFGGFMPNEKENPECNSSHSLSKQYSPPMPTTYECLIVSSNAGTTTINSLEMFRRMFIPVNTPEKALLFVDTRGERSGDVSRISGGYLVRIQSSIYSACSVPTTYSYGTWYRNDEIWFVRESGEVSLVAKQEKPNSEYWCSLWNSILYRNTPSVQI